MSDIDLNDLPDHGSWRPLSDPNPYNAHSGPFFERHDELDLGEPIRFGFRVRDYHCNQREICHGGLLAGFLDMALSRALSAAEGFFGSTPTISLSLEFFDGAPLGSWVDSRVTVFKRSNQLGFLQALLLSGDTILVRGSGVYKRPRKPEPG